MRAPIPRLHLHIQSLNWRLIWITTFLFMGLYFLAFDTPPSPLPSHSQNHTLIPPPNKEKDRVGPTPAPRKKNPWADRFEDVHVEDPYPVMGKGFDSPLDAIPGRERPVRVGSGEMEEEEKEKSEKEKEEEIDSEEKEKAEKENSEKETAEPLKEKTESKEKEKEVKEKTESEEKEKSEKEKTEEDKAEQVKEDTESDEKEKPEKAEVKSTEDKPEKEEEDHDILTEESQKNETLKDEQPKHETPKDEKLEDEKLEEKKLTDENLKNDKPKDMTSKDENVKDDSPKDEKPIIQTSKNGNANNEKTKDEDTKKEEPKEAIPKDEKPQDEKPEDEDSADEKTKDKPKDENSKDDPPKKDKQESEDDPKEDSLGGEKPKDEEAANEKPKEESLEDKEPTDSTPKTKDQKEDSLKDEKAKEDTVNDKQSKDDQPGKDKLESESGPKKTSLSDESSEDNDQSNKDMEEDERLAEFKNKVEEGKPTQDDKTAADMSENKYIDHEDSSREELLEAMAEEGKLPEPDRSKPSWEFGLKDRMKAIAKEEEKLVAPIMNALKNAQEKAAQPKNQQSSEGTPNVVANTDSKESADKAEKEVLALARSMGIIEDPKVPEDDYIALCLAVKDQADDLMEFFVHHYHHLGIRRFYIMDDRSNPPMSTLKDDWGIPKRYITFEDQSKYIRSDGNREQKMIYSRCMENFGEKHVWMGFIDADEFLEMTGKETLQAMLHEYQERSDVGALAINWRMHTSSGHKTRQESVRKAYVDCIWDDDEHGGKASNNSHVKVIVRTSMAGSPVGPHMWRLSRGYTWGEHMDRIDSIAWRTPITRDRIALHHYAGKSREEYEEKMQRGNAMDDPKGEGFWNSLENGLPKVSCPEMAKYDP